MLGLWTGKYAGRGLRACPRPPPPHTKLSPQKKLKTKREIKKKKNKKKYKKA